MCISVYISSSIAILLRTLTKAAFHICDVYIGSILCSQTISISINVSSRSKLDKGCPLLTSQECIRALEDVWL